MKPAIFLFLLTTASFAQKTVSPGTPVTPNVPTTPTVPNPNNTRNTSPFPSDQTQQQVDRVFKFLTEDRLPLIRNSGPAILEEYRQRIGHEVNELENALARATAAPATPEAQQQLATLRDRIVAALETKVDLP